MARQFVDPDVEVFRVVVTTKKQYRNPDYNWRTAQETGEKPYYYSDEIVTTFYGPYRKGAAKTQLKAHTHDGYGKVYENFVGAHIEKANIVWEDYPV